MRTSAARQPSESQAHFRIDAALTGAVSDLVDVFVSSALKSSSLTRNVIRLVWMTALSRGQCRTTRHQKKGQA